MAVEESTWPLHTQVLPSAAGFAPVPMPRPRAERLFFLDNLRVFATCVVIAHHVGQAYGPTGGAWPIGETARAAVLGPFFTVNRSFGMSLFFLIAGYLMVRSYDAHGPRPFRDRPADPPGHPGADLHDPHRAHHDAHGRGSSREREHLRPARTQRAASLVRPAPAHLQPVLRRYPRLPGPQVTTEAAGRSGKRLSREPPLSSFSRWPSPSSAPPSGIWFPIDYWVNPAFIRVAFADVPRDLSFFVIGALACRHDWLRRYPSRAGYAWLAAGLLLGAFWYVYALSSPQPAAIPTGAAGLAYAVWESLLCCGMCIGLMVLFRDVANVRTPLLAELGRGQYLAYVIHIAPVLALQAAALALPTAPLAKFVLVTVAAVPLTFMLAAPAASPVEALTAAPINLTDQ